MAWINKVLNIVILILLIGVLIEINYYKLDDCDKCKFKLGDKTYTSANILDLYVMNCTKAPESLFDKFNVPKTNP